MKTYTAQEILNQNLQEEKFAHIISGEVQTGQEWIDDCGDYMNDAAFVPVDEGEQNELFNVSRSSKEAWSLKAEASFINPTRQSRGC